MKRRFPQVSSQERGRERETTRICAQESDDMKSTTTIITIDDTMIVIPSNDYSGKSGWV
jgi:hypothetical protein